MTIRIYLEAKWTADIRIIGVAHTYLVMRDIPEGVDPDYFIGSELDEASEWIGGHPTNEFLAGGARGAGGKIETSLKEFYTGDQHKDKDWYYRDDGGAAGTPLAERRKLDITDIVANATGKSAADAWALLTAYANGIDGKYDYSIPLRVRNTGTVYN
jgi:hypothetical protein